MKRWLVLLAACNQVYGLDGTSLRPDAAIVDKDLDFVDDAHDNCVRVGNTDQFDEDFDGFGDACDNCPLLSNADQQDIGDGDGVGDRCDPHPQGARDCLIVFDSFRDRTKFDTNWEQQGNGAVDPRSDEIVMSSPSTLYLLARDEQGATLSDELDVALVGRVEAPNALSVGALLSGTGFGFMCGVTGDSLLFIHKPMTGTFFGGPDPWGKALDDNLYARLDMTQANGNPALRCIVEHGILFRDMTEFGRSGESAGGVGILTSGTAVVTGFTAYKNVGTSTTCPAPILR